MDCFKTGLVNGAAMLHHPGHEWLPSGQCNFCSAVEIKTLELAAVTPAVC